MGHKHGWKDSHKVGDRTIWVAVGCNVDPGSDDEDASWFYAFETPEDAFEFTRKVEAQTGLIRWSVYPCDLYAVDDKVKNVLENLKD